MSDREEDGIPEKLPDETAGELDTRSEDLPFIVKANSEAARWLMDHSSPRPGNRVGGLDEIDGNESIPDPELLDALRQSVGVADHRSPPFRLPPFDARRVIDLAAPTAAEIAMRKADEMALETPVDHRDPQQVAVAENPYVARKEAVLKEVISSKYSLRRSALMRPERGRMVVARVEWADQIGSIFLPQETKEMHTAGNMEIVVLACGENRIDPASGREVKMQYSPRETIGKHAVIRSLSGMEFIWYDENGKQFVCYLIGQSEIWMWLEPPPGYESEMQNSPDLQAALRYIESGLAQKALPAKSDECTCPPYLASGLHLSTCPVHFDAVGGR